jgi:hypothetical protein
MITLFDNFMIILAIRDRGLGIGDWGEDKRDKGDNK